ncbi:hypothetical protein [Dyadobacter pollutisoli]|uniref:Uncharacterized protein n=1 Tax=Dyadobacter pollutisoli TaxID=2910158 RepID=A0A9E8SJV8_9BACT|nr:hypothetical protein [Dyadobacter pollutisoli]WAC10141.1 hypothetical protein ON006_20555 [Dyadobacter pollutisoli]
MKNPSEEIVKRKDNHINKYLRDALPEPEIPADDAWAQMNGMLFPNSVGTPQSVAGKLAKYVSQFKWPLLTALGGISISLLVIFSPDLKTIASRAKKENRSNDTLKFSEVKPENAIDEYRIPESKKGNAQPSQGEEKYEIANKADDNDHLVSEESQAVPTNDRTNLANEEAVTINNKHVNASPSHEKRISNVNKKPDLKPQSGNAAVIHSSDNGQNRALNSFRSGKASGATSSGIGNGGAESNAGRGSGSTGNNDVASGLAKEYNVPGSPNAPVNIQPVRKNLTHSLQSLPFQYKAFNADLSKKINAPKTSAPARAAENKKTRNLPVHFGLEWNLNSPLQRTAYLFTGIDSVSRPARLLIPGIVISKKWTNHTLSFIFSPYQPYFGNNKRVQQLSDTIAGNDSAKIYKNTNLIKASGMNFTLQYQYQVIGPLLLNAGLSYSTFSSALIRKETENRFGNILQGPLETVKKSGDLRSYLNPGFFALKAGLAVRPAVWQGRIQAGFNVTLPISNISRSAENPVRALNGQVYLRIMVR